MSEGLANQDVLALDVICSIKSRQIAMRLKVLPNLASSCISILQAHAAAFVPTCQSNRWAFPPDQQKSVTDEVTHCQIYCCREARFRNTSNRSWQQQCRRWPKGKFQPYWKVSKKPLSLLTLIWPMVTGGQRQSLLSSVEAWFSSKL